MLRMPGQSCHADSLRCRLAEVFCAQGLALKKIVKYATAKGFTDVAVFNEDRKQVNGLLLIHLPGGPTAHFRISSLKLSKEIKACPYLSSKLH